MGDSSSSKGASQGLPNYLAERYQTWHERRFQPDQAWYTRLAEDGQRPRAMVISCCDSRVDVGGIFGAEPGDLFIVRNVANLVPPFQPDHMHHGTSAALEYAVKNLKVAHIIVLGHAHCGGVAACRALCNGQADAALTDSLFIRHWTEILKPAYDNAMTKTADLDEQSREAALPAILEQEGVRTSLNNLKSFPFIQEAVETGKLSLHGAWINISDGVLMALSSETGEFEAVEA